MSNWTYVWKCKNCGHIEEFKFEPCRKCGNIHINRIVARYNYDSASAWSIYWHQNFAWKQLPGKWEEK